VEAPLSSRRLAALIDSGIALASELDLDSLLQRIADLSREVIGAKYGAVGVVGEDGLLVKFLHSGIDEDTVRKIGELPSGRGVLGQLVEEGRTLRLREISQHPRSYGFPPHHPEMHSFLGVPIVVRGRVFGRLYLTEKQGIPEFTKDDEGLALLFAAQAGVAIENARLYNDVRDRSEELAYRLAELSSFELIGRLLLSGTSTNDMLRSVVEEALLLTRASRASLTLLDQETGDLLVRVAVGDQVAADLVGSRIPKDTSKAHGVIKRMKSEVVEDMSRDPEVHAENWRLLGEPRTGAFAPLVVRHEAVGALGIYERAGGRGFSDDDLTVLEMLASMAAIALENERLNEALRDLAVLEERDRISKELHDGVIQSIYSVGLSLQGSVSMIGRDPKLVKQRIDQAISELDNVVRDVRGYIFELRPKIIEEGGLQEAVIELARDLEINTLAQAHVDLDEEACDSLDGQGQAHVIQIVREILSNIARHAQASEVSLRFKRLADEVLLSIEDNGVGFDPDSVSAGHGLQNMRERAARLGGSLTISSRKPKGTIHRLLVSVGPDGGDEGA
jgi:signal transduction histidine kinase